jgi:hypothetical protein
MHLKIIRPDSFDFQGKPVTCMVKMSSRGLIGNDRADFLKFGSHEIVDALGSVKLAKNEIPLYLAAIGSTEYYGPNRNGDGFREATNRATHNTFEKYARVYRDHQNKDPEKSYGRVIKSAYHDPVHRIELLVGLNGDEKVASLNGGLVADKELEKIASGKEIPWSMACRIDHDVCSGCGNKARTREDYCDESNCKYGGLQHNIAKMASDGHILHADNPNPRHFDISHVWRPADRIAYAFGVLEKAAEGRVVGGAELAERMGLTLPLALLLEDAPQAAVDQIKIASILADLDNGQRHGSDLAFSAAVRLPFEMPNLGNSSSLMKEALCALARHRIVLPVQEFLTLATGNEKIAAEVASSVQSRLPGIFRRMLLSDDVTEKLASNPFVPSRACGVELDRWALRMKQAFGVEPSVVRDRATRASIRGVNPDTLSTVKEAAANETDDMLARQYALYKIAALAVIKTEAHDFAGIATSSIRQHYVV